MKIEKALENNKDFNPDNFIDLRKSQETILNAILLTRENIKIKNKKLTIKELSEIFMNKPSLYKHWKDINHL